MSISLTDIANLALNHVGQPPIMRLDDKDNDNARIVELVFEPTLREMARDHEWNCLSARVDLPQLANAPAFGYEFQYRRPIDDVRALMVNGHRVGRATSLYTIEGRNILTDADIMLYRYSEFTLDSTVYDSMFVGSGALFIGSKIAISIRQDEGLAEKLYLQYKNSVLPAARKVDGNERNKAPYDGREQSRSLQSRQTGTRNGAVRTDS